MSNFAIYMIGSILVASAVGFAAYQFKLSAIWITIIVLLILGFGIMGGVRKTRRRESSDTEN
jgi:hypothetical protein